MFAIINGTVFTMAGPPISRGTVLVEGSKIVQVGRQLPLPDDIEVFDATGKLVLPGLIDAHTHVGIMEEIYRLEGDDTNETSNPVTPHLRAIDAVNPYDLGFQDALAGGVTTVVTGPGSANVVGGEMVVMKTHGTVVDDMIIRFPAGLKCALGENPKRVYGSGKKMPATRMASAALLRETLVAAQNYLVKQKRAAAEGNIPERDLQMEAVVRVLKKEVPLRVHAHRADDIMTAVRIAREFDLDLVVEHCTEGHLIAPWLAAAGVKAVVGPVISNRAKVELMNRSLETALALCQAGVPFALMTDHPVVPIQYLSLSAALAVKGGLPEETALKAITVDAAGLLGIRQRVGSLEAGKDADIIVADRSLFDPNHRIEMVFVNGCQVIGKK
ncbi:amidohydrolase [Desulforamulus hydrothermalis]|uniref:Amidohydrolase n=1 Tax=Desulforamulus hydrothermalis Lam5 = DSM 18033 TaxID=1121428 RepID=K8DYZ7_9FIRM|nr:amidohydrolase [Desulforamulus hydrothermalis]CCO08085.1 Amidohydrolase [Desulforamulus hydrothermalis Lam5 = DSM 18033]SHG82340.1 Imidazolonepropionase [Desulforamulus hydrothermalis Lam5 = DSM 18033]